MTHTKELVCPGCAEKFANREEMDAHLKDAGEELLVRHALDHHIELWGRFQDEYAVLENVLDRLAARGEFGDPFSDPNFDRNLEMAHAELRGRLYAELERREIDFVRQD